MAIMMIMMIIIIIINMIIIIITLLHNVTIIVEVEAPLGKPPVFYRKSSSWAELFVGIRNQFS